MRHYERHMWTGKDYAPIPSVPLSPAELCYERAKLCYDLMALTLEEDVPMSPSLRQYVESVEADLAGLVATFQAQHRAEMRY